MSYAELITRVRAISMSDTQLDEISVTSIFCRNMQRGLSQIRIVSWLRVQSSLPKTVQLSRQSSDADSKPPRRRCRCVSS